MKIIDYVKRNPLLVLSAFLFSLFPYLLVPNLLLASIVSSLSFSLSFYFGMKGFAYCQACGITIASLSFFSAFLVALDKGVSGKQSYDTASKYLSSYIEIHPYEDLVDNHTCPYPIGKYKEDFLYVLEKDSKNESHLPNYFTLEKDIEKTLRSCKESVSKAYRLLLRRSAFLLLFFLAFSFVVSLTPNLQEALSQSRLYLFISFVSILLLFPCIHFDFFFQMKEVKSDVC